jgi:hypothetical protein
VNLRRLCRSQDLEALPSGHGGKGENGDLLAIPASFLSAGRGGEGKNGCGASLRAPVTRSRLVDGCRLLGISFSSASPTRHGGEKEVDLEAAASLRWGRPLPRRCYSYKLIHEAGNHAALIQGR